MRAILTYHSVDASGSVISVAPADFARHVRWLAASPLRVVPLADLPHAPGDAVAITFDDAYANLAASALPLLAEHGMPATVFVVSGHVGGTNAWDDGAREAIPELPLLDWDALGRLAESGVAVGAHTRTHPRLDALDGVALEDEIVGGADDIARRLGVRPAAFAYPYGAVSGAAAAVARRAFGCAVTTELRVLRPAEDAALLPRLDMFYLRRAGALESWGSPRFRASLAARRAARRARRYLGIA